MLLGLIVEKISGMNYFDYIRENIYKKAGMTDSDCYEMDTDVPNLAIGYTKMGPDEKPLQGGRKNNLFLHVVKGGPAGGGFSTARDLLKFDIALRSNKLLGAKYTDIVLTGKADTPRRGAKYAYGFIDRRAGATRIVGHGGGFAGINSNLDMYLDSGYTVVVMSNYDPPAAQQVSEKIRQLLTQ
jgi:CubicO group peptidase (beta-lactamase class C family)